jgi:hypothetical protein
MAKSGTVPSPSQPLRHVIAHPYTSRVSHGKLHYFCYYFSPKFLILYPHAWTYSQVILPVYSPTAAGTPSPLVLPMGAGPARASRLEPSAGRWGRAVPVPRTRSNERSRTARRQGFRPLLAPTAPRMYTPHPHKGHSSCPWAAHMSRTRSRMSAPGTGRPGPSFLGRIYRVPAGTPVARSYHLHWRWDALTPAMQ